MSVKPVSESQRECRSLRNGEIRRFACSSLYRNLSVSDLDEIGNRIGWSSATVALTVAGTRHGCKAASVLRYQRRVWTRRG